MSDFLNPNPPEFVPYDERTDEVFPPEGLWVNSKKIVKEVETYLRGLPEEDTPIQTMDTNFPLRLQDLKEIEFDVGDVNTSQLFKELIDYYPYLNLIPHGNIKPTKDIKITNYYGLIRFDYTSNIEGDDTPEFAITIGKIPSNIDPDRMLLEVEMVESHRLITRTNPDSNTNTNIFYFRENGMIRIIGNTWSKEQYLVNRANTAQNKVPIIVKRALRAIVPEFIPHSIDSKPAPL